MICTLRHYYLGDEIENEIGGACSIYGKEKRCVQSFVEET
jgi:hypothetical protein